jgi:hypothetical protein
MEAAMFHARRAARSAHIIVLCILGMLALTSQAQAGAIDLAPNSGLNQITESWDVAVDDYNVDGYPDFIFSPQNGLARQLWRNNGNGTFSLATTLPGEFINDQHGCAWADVDRNGLPDAYCILGATGGTRTKANSLWMQVARGVFDDQGIARGVDDPFGRGRNATFVDANGDGFPDLFVTNYRAPRSNGTVAPNRFFLNLGRDATTGEWLGFRSAPEYGLDKPEGERGCTSTVDFNRDGRGDIVFCGAGTLRMYRNDGNGFTDVHSAWLGGDMFVADTAITDVTGDGIRDLVYVSLKQFAYRPGWPNGGGFGPVTQARALYAGRSIAVADVNGDGYKDVYVLQSSGPPGCVGCAPDRPDLLLLNNGSGIFRQVDMPQYTVGAGDKAYAIDIMHDGSSEIIQTNGANFKKAAMRILRFTP